MTEILHPGGKFGDYTVVRLLGKGGMGEVWLLRAPSGVEVAAKILNPEDAADHESRRRFLREAELAMGVKHPNLVETYDVGEDPETGLCYILMEYMPGGTLADRLKAGPLPVREALAIAYQIASVLELAHAKGIVHRDIKPANIMFGANGKARLADLGIARGGAGANATTVTRTGMMIGTPAYMAPEQMLDAHAVDSRADIYSLGIVLYEMLAGRRPNADDTVVQLMAKAVAGEPIPDIRSQRPEVAAAVAELVGLMCAMKADERLSSPREVTTAISQIIHGREVTIRRRAPAVVRKKRSVPLGVVLPVVAFAAVALSASLWWLFRAPAAVPVDRQVVITNTVIRSVAVTNEVARSIAVTNEVARSVAATNVTTSIGAAIPSAKPKGTGLPPKVLELSGDVPPLEFIGCPPGECELGGETVGNELYEHRAIPRHRARMSRPFWFGKALVSFEQWAAFAKKIEPSEVERAVGGPRCAVAHVSYLDVSVAADRLTRRFRDQLPEGYVIRLPTEAENGYAYAAGGADPSQQDYRLAGVRRREDLSRRISAAGYSVQRYLLPKGEVGTGVSNAWGVVDLYAGGTWLLDLVSGPANDFSSHQRHAEVERARLSNCRYDDSMTDPLFFTPATTNGMKTFALFITSSGYRGVDVEFDSGHPGIGVRLVIAPDILKERGLTLPTRPKASIEVATKGETDRRVRDDSVPPRENPAPATARDAAHAPATEEFPWHRHFPATVPMSQALAASLKSSGRETTPEMEEKIGQLKAVLEEMKLAVEPIVNAETLFAAGRAIRDLEQLVARFRKLKTSSTGRNRLTRREEQNEIVSVAEAKSKLLEWLLYFAVEDRTAHVPLEKARKATERNLKVQREKLNRMKRSEGNGT